MFSPSVVVRVFLFQELAELEGLTEAQIQLPCVKESSIDYLFAL